MKIVCYYTVKESYGKFPLSWETGKTRKFQSVYKGENLLHIMEYIKKFFIRKGVVRKCLNLWRAKKVSHSLN